MLERSGFVDIQEQVLRAPLNTWPKDAHQKAVGRRYCACLLEWLEALSLQPLSKTYSWRKEDISALLRQVGKAMLNKKIHAYNNM